MNLINVIEIGLREILAHKFRSFLSMLGIVLGVSSLVATMALTAGIERGTRAFMRQMGGLEMVRIINKEISNEMFDFWNLSPGRTLQDAYAIRQAAPLVSHVSPELSEGVVLSNANATLRARATGVWPDYKSIMQIDLQAGRFISDLDIERAHRCAVIGSAVAQRLWPKLPPAEVAGKSILINQVAFQVVGVLVFYERESERQARLRGVQQAREQRRRERGNVRETRRDPFRAKNEACLIPFTTMFYEFKSGQFPDDSIDTVRLENLVVRVGNLDVFNAALDQMRAALAVTHRGVDDFGFETREDWFDNMETSIRATRTSGGLIALISLVVGGIGITNIMLASISERVREIGIRRAVGARSRDIFLQILMESVSVSLIGGVIGIGAGIALIAFLTTVAPGDNAPFITPASLALSMAFAVVAGIASGIYPAISAARLDPIQALRYE